MNPFRRRRIILATDLSARCDRAFERAVVLTREWDAQLTVAHALEREPVDRGLSLRWRGIDVERQKAESQILADLQRAGIAADVVVREGWAPELIGELTRKMPCDLIVAGIGRELGLARAIHGSTLEALARKSVAPVLTVKSPVRGSYDSAVVGANFSDGSRAAIQATLQLFQNAKVTALHAYRRPRESFGGQQGSDATYLHHLSECTRFVADAVPDAWQEIRCLAEIGFPETLLKQYVLDRRVDLIAVGLEERHPISTFLVGGTVRPLIRSAPCDLLIIPARWAPSPARRATLEEIPHGHEEVPFIHSDDFKPALRQNVMKANTRMRR
jgi:nucleotide-binding universal stress UspA family protein